MKLSLITFLVFLVGCTNTQEKEYYQPLNNNIQMVIQPIDLIETPDSLQRFNATHTDLMDTIITFAGYAYTQEDFDTKLSYITNELERIHNLFTTFEQVHGVNNLWYVNQNAGITPVVVSPDIIKLLQHGIEAYHLTSGMLNIAMGSVLDIWHRERISQTPYVPTIEELQIAKSHVNINDIIIDEELSTVFITNPNMTIEVGAIAKGMAIENVIEIAQNIGLEHFLISIGGDVRLLSSPPETDNWSVGVQNPSNPNDRSILLDIIRAENMAVFTSGNYQRFFVVNGNKYHHIIDPTTLFPANLYKSITVIHENSIIAEVLTTALYMISIEDGKNLLDKLGGYALWITTDNQFIASEGYSHFSDNF